MHGFMKKITTELKNGRVLVSDGAWGTFLQQKGLKPGECPEEWNISRPGDVLAIAKSYIDSGADMVETNSFGGSCFKLAKYGFGDKVFEFNKAAAELSRKAAGPDHYVLGSVGPTGKLLIMEEVSEAQMYEAFREQCMALEAGGVDAIMIETMTDLDEARIAVKAARENTSCEVFCTMTFEKIIGGGYRTMMGNSPTEMAETIVGAGADLIGTNCGNGIADMIGMVQEIRLANPTIPILVHANAGMPRFLNGVTSFPESPDDMATRVKEIIDAGAGIVGGCCGTTPAHIGKVKEVVQSILAQMTIIEFAFSFKDLRPDTRKLQEVLGFPEGQMPEPFQAYLDEAFEFATDLDEFKAALTLVEVLKLEPAKGRIHAAGTTFTVGKTICKELRGAERLLIFVCTAGNSLGEKSTLLLKGDDPVKGYIYDQVGTFLVEAVAEKMQERMAEELAFTGNKITNRYSPGYCHWEVAEQHRLFAFFANPPCGVTLTTSALMNPVKSISGIIGVGRTVNYREYPCALCLSLGCIYRKVT